MMVLIPSFSRLVPRASPPPHASPCRPNYAAPRLVRVSSPRPCRPQLRSLAPAPHSARFSAQDNGGGSDTLEEEKEKAEEDIEKEKVREEVAELKELMAERKRREEEKPPGLIDGVAEEVREIEWPAFGKVLGTTGVVLAVIAGSSVALLTVNAILAEVSDRVFAGKGIQDFF